MPNKNSGFIPAYTKPIKILVNFKNFAISKKPL